MALTGLLLFLAWMAGGAIVAIVVALVAVFLLLEWAYHGRGGT